MSNPPKHLTADLRSRAYLSLRLRFCKSNEQTKIKKDRFSLIGSLVLSLFGTPWNLQPVFRNVSFALFDRKERTNEAGTDQSECVQLVPVATLLTNVSFKLSDRLTLEQNRFELLQHLQFYLMHITIRLCLILLSFFGRGFGVGVGVVYLYR